MIDVASLIGSFAYGLSGSVHCVVMCGPLAIVSSSPVITRKRALPVLSDATLQNAGHSCWSGATAYHLARIAGYAALGGIFGSLGQALDLAFGVTVSKLLPYLLVTLLLGSTFNAGGWIAGRVRFLPKLPLRLPRAGLTLPLALGGLTALIPCGFLYSTAPLAVAAGSPAGGALTLTAFSLGTAPLLLLTSFTGQLPGPTRFVLTRLKPALLCLAALVIVTRTTLMQPSQASAPPVCHHDR